MATVTSPRSPVPKAGKAERPLPPAVLFLLACTVGLFAFLAYLYCVVAALVIGLMILVHLGLLLVGLRFGLAEFFAKSIAAQVHLAGLFLRGLRLQSGPDTHVSLVRAYAPELFDHLEAVARRIGVPVPDDVRLEMLLNASVQLKGVRKGRGHTILTVGYDLLATLTQDELDSVLAHELAHAKLIQRGYKGWASKAIGRLSQIANTLQAINREHRAAKKTFATAAVLGAGFHLIAKGSNRALAAYCRQDEFAADRAAAEVCGTAVYRGTLEKIDQVAVLAAKLSWRERLIKSQREQSYSGWLRNALLPHDEAHRAALAAEARADDSVGEYDTHPPLEARIAALPVDESTVTASPPAMDLLQDPDGLADQLFERGEQAAIQVESEESGQLLSQARKAAPASKMTGLQILGLSVVIAGALVLVLGIALYTDVNVDGATKAVAVVAGIALIAVGAVVMQRGQPNLKDSLPAPPLGLWESAVREVHGLEDAKTWLDEAKADAESVRIPSVITSRKERARFWERRIYDALRQCDYKQAFGAAVQLEPLNRKSAAYLFAVALTASLFGDRARGKGALAQAVQSYRLGPSVSWAIGWSAALLGDWVEAEGYLQDAKTHRPDEPTITALLGICQWQRDKLRESIRNLRRAAELAPKETRIRYHLARTLADAGRPRDAEPLLTTDDIRESEELDVQLLRLRVSLLLDRHGEAEGLCRQIEEAHPGGKALLGLGHAFQDAKLTDRARAYLERATELAFYPDALVRLAYLDHEEKTNPDLCKQRLLAALDVTKEAGEGSAPALALLEPACHGLTEMREKSPKCAGWVANVNMASSPAPVNQMSLLVFAPHSAAAGALVKELYDAMHPDNSAPPGHRVDAVQ
jgi:Zn-dependent protease with chaperone function/Flp pilus assembly protein TadD